MIRDLCITAYAVSGYVIFWQFLRGVRPSDEKWAVGIGAFIWLLLGPVLVPGLKVLDLGVKWHYARNHH